MVPSLLYLPPSPPPGGLSLQQRSLDLSLRAPRVRKQKLPAFLKARLGTHSVTSTIFHCSQQAQVKPRFKGWKSRFPLLVETDGHTGKEELLAALCGNKPLSCYRGRKGRRKTSQLLLLFVITISIFSSSCPSKSASPRGRHMSWPWYHALWAGVALTCGIKQNSLGELSSQSVSPWLGSREGDLARRFCPGSQSWFY